MTAPPLRCGPLSMESAVPHGGGWRVFVLRATDGAMAPNGTGEGRDADDQPADPQAANGAKGAQQGAGAAGFAAEARGLHQGLYDHPEEAELGLAQGRKGEADQR